VRRLLLLLLAVPALAGCGTAAAPLPPSYPASPQRAELAWVESIGDRTGRLVFGVRSFEVTRDGWRAQISLANETAVPFAVGSTRLQGSLAFGVMLFSTGRHSELDTRNANGSLPTLRPAERYQPPLPDKLGAHATWTATIAAHGPLAAGTWARVEFGALFPVIEQQDTPEPKLPDALRKANVQNGLLWITDHAYELKR
jgi:hypothetical protein